jgi:hypothetical protein
MIGAQLTLNGWALTPVGTANGVKKKQLPQARLEPSFHDGDGRHTPMTYRCLNREFDRRGASPAGAIYDFLVSLVSRTRIAIRNVSEKKSGPFCRSAGCLVGWWREGQAGRPILGEGAD